MNILSYVAAVTDSSKARPDMKVDVSQETMLGIMRTDSDSARGSVANLEIYVADGRIKRTRIRVRRRLIPLRARTCKEKHICRIPLKPRSVSGEYEDRAGRPKSEQADFATCINTSSDP